MSSSSEEMSEHLKKIFYPPHLLKLKEEAGRHCAGLVVEWGGGIKILTSAYLLGESTDASDYRVKILLPNHKTVKACVMYVDENHNFAILHSELELELELEGLQAATIDAKTVDLGDRVVAVGRNWDYVGRNWDYMLKGSYGKVNRRGDHFESDDLLSSSCNISQVTTRLEGLYPVR